eukprot:3729480-Alexandrium_andersonii.AAC.1
MVRCGCCWNLGAAQSIKAFKPSSTASVDNSMTRTEGGHLTVHDRSPGSPAGVRPAQPCSPSRAKLEGAAGGQSVPRETPRVQAPP